MKKFNPIIEKYKNKGVSAENIEYAIDSVKYGIKREYIIEGLTARYRGMSKEEATSLLEELFVANGGEFKKENRSGYLYGAFFLLVGFACAFYTFLIYTQSQLVHVRILLMGTLATLAGIVCIVSALFGKYRDIENPLQD